MKEYHINYIDRKYSQNKLRAEVEFNEVERENSIDPETGEVMENVISSVLIEKVVFVMPADFSDEQVLKDVRDYQEELGNR